MILYFSLYINSLMSWPLHFFCGSVILGFNFSKNGPYQNLSYRNRFHFSDWHIINQLIKNIVIFLLCSKSKKKRKAFQIRYNSSWNKRGSWYTHMYSRNHSYGNEKIVEVWYKEYSFVKRVKIQCCDWVVITSIKYWQQLR